MLWAEFGRQSVQEVQRASVMMETNDSARMQTSPRAPWDCRGGTDEGYMDAKIAVSLSETITVC
jgi:hypothetical protein